MRTTIVRAVGALGLALSAAAASAADYGVNLILNGNAEQGVTGWTAFSGYPVFQSVAYGSNWVLPTQPGPVDRGSSLFVGGSGVAYAAGYQVVDLSANAAQIDAGLVSYDMTGWLGGWTNQGDNAMLYVTFLDGVGNQVGDVALGPVTPADRGNQTGLFFREQTGFVPSGTTSMQLSLSMQRLVSGDNDGYADNLSFVLTAVPEPGSWAMLAVGLLAVGARIRRSRQA
jgi:hypothetical protein